MDTCKKVDINCTNSAGAINDFSLASKSVFALSAGLSTASSTIPIIPQSHSILNQACLQEVHFLFEFFQAEAEYILKSCPDIFFGGLRCSY